MNFVVYHSGYERTGPREGLFTPATAHLGTNRLIAAMRRHGVRPTRTARSPGVAFRARASAIAAAIAPRAAGRILERRAQKTGTSRLARSVPRG